MGLFEKLPYTNFHEINLNWIIREIKRLREDVEEIRAELDELQEAEEDEPI